MVLWFINRFIKEGLKIVISNYQLGVIWSIGTYLEDESRMVFRHNDRYFLEQLKNLTQNNIYLQSTPEKRYYVLKIPEMDIKHLESLGWTDRNSDTRYMPVLNDYKDFLRPYIELHSSLDYNKRASGIKRLRLRVYGNETLIREMNQIISFMCNVRLKTPQIIHNNKTAILYYQAFEEIDNIFSGIKGEPYNPTFWDEIIAKLSVPEIN